MKSTSLSPLIKNLAIRKIKKYDYHVKRSKNKQLVCFFSQPNSTILTKMKIKLPKTKRLAKKINLKHKHLGWPAFSAFFLGLVVGLVFLTQTEHQLNEANRHWQSQFTQTEIARQQLALENEQLVEAYEKIATDSAVKANQEWTEALAVYQALQVKYDEYNQKGVEVDKAKSLLLETIEELLSADYQASNKTASAANEKLDSLLAEKIKAEAEAAQKIQIDSAMSYGSQPTGGYSRISVGTSRGSFITDVVMVDLGQIRVITSTANDNDCAHQCPTKPLADHIAQNSGFAGINGSYFCPADYASCADKINSFDFPVYKTSGSKWINGGNLFWNSRAMIWFDGGSTPHFCPNANSCNTGGIAAGIVNYPALVSNGQIIVDEGGLSDSLRTVRGYRGGIGFSGNWLYLIVARGATVPDLAYIMQAMGIQHGMNLDGGGSTALYHYGYRVGPGRSLPNAVVIASR